MLLCLMGGWMAQPGFADIDPAEYALKNSVRSVKEHKRLEAEFAAARKREGELQRQEEEREARRLAEERAAWDALPYPLRLNRTRCTVCHAADNYMNQRHNRIGWELVILRMQYINDAVLASGERGVIAAHLAQAYPATGRTALTEVLQQLAVALFPAWFWLLRKVGRSRCGKTLGGS